MSILAESGSGALRLDQRKALLRASVLAERDRMPGSVRKERSRVIVTTVTSLPDFASAASVLLTSSFGSEVETGELVAHSLACGKTLLLPLVNKESRMLELYEVSEPGSQLARGTYGIAEPRLDRCRRASYAEVEWVLVPGVVYAGDGFRIGYGGGYYDRLLPLLAPAVPRVSAAFELQRRPQVPHGAHDQQVDFVVSEAGVYRVGSSRV
jgi:5-formyltetrahydrofolate cyclo-ligase